RVSDRFRAICHAERRGERSRDAPDADIPRRPRWQPTDFRSPPAYANRPAFPGSPALLRILSRRYGPRRWRLASDRLDRSGSETADAPLFPYRAQILNQTRTSL